MAQQAGVAPERLVQALARESLVQAAVSLPSASALVPARGSMVGALMPREPLVPVPS